MKRSNTVSVHRSGDRRHTQVKSSSRRLLAQSSRSHPVGLSQYFHQESTKVEGHSLGRSPGPNWYHFSPTLATSSLPISQAQTHTRSSREEEEEHGPDPNSVLSRVSCGPKPQPLNPLLITDGTVCTHVYVWICRNVDRRRSVSEVCVGVTRGAAADVYTPRVFYRCRCAKGAHFLFFLLFPFFLFRRFRRFCRFRGERVEEEEKGEKKKLKAGGVAARRDVVHLR